MGVFRSFIGYTNNYSFILDNTHISFNENLFDFNFIFIKILLNTINF